MDSILAVLLRSRRGSFVFESRRDDIFVEKSDKFENELRRSGIIRYSAPPELGSF
jgi:hypothetical protein